MASDCYLKETRGIVLIMADVQLYVDFELPFNCDRRHSVLGYMRKQKIFLTFGRDVDL